MLRAATLAVLALVLPGAVNAAGSPHGHHAPGSKGQGPGMSPATSCTAPVLGPVPAEVLMKPVGLRQGLGKVHERVTTASREAQALYDQGVAYVHGYVWIEAARSFHQALRLDPALAMAHLGLARVHVSLRDLPAARHHATAARRLSSKVSPREQLRIEAALLQLAAVEAPQDGARLTAYREALDKALVADLENPEVWLLRGNAEERVASGIGQQGRLATLAFYESARLRAPEHPAPHHYLVHTFENLGLFQRALEAGAKYAQLSPQVPHALHMYGHDLMKTGRIPEAIDYFSRADSLERSYYLGESISPELDWHHGHNMALLGMSHRYLGHEKRAESLFREVASLKPFRPEFGFMYRMDLISYLLGRGRSAEVLALTAKVPQVTALERALDVIANGRAQVQLGKLDEARKASERARAALPEVEKGYSDWPGFPTFMTKSFLDLLDGLVLYQNSATRADGRKRLEAFAATVRTAFTGPDQWIAGLYELESIAREARRQGDWAFARAMTAHLEAHDPTYPGTLYARALLAERDGDRATASKLFASAAAGWKGADPAHEDAQKARGKATAARP